MVFFKTFFLEYLHLKCYFGDWKYFSYLLSKQWNWLRKRVLAFFENPTKLQSQTWCVQPWSLELLRIMYPPSHHCWWRNHSVRRQRKERKCRLGVFYTSIIWSLLLCGKVLSSRISRWMQKPLIKCNTGLLSASSNSETSNSHISGIIWRV